MNARLSAPLATLVDGLDHQSTPARSLLAPLVRCADCALNLQQPVRAAFWCPLFGKSRRDAELRCSAFSPRETGYGT